MAPASGPPADAEDVLPALTFGDGPNLVVALHGITASAMTWPPVARRLSAQWTLVAPDLRGRGAAFEAQSNGASSGTAGAPGKRAVLSTPARGISTHKGWR